MLQLILMPRGPPGLCLSLDGSRARVEVALRCPIVPTAFTLEHIPRNISFERGSAPRLVAMFGSLAAPLHSPERSAPDLFDVQQQAASAISFTVILSQTP